MENGRRPVFDDTPFTFYTGREDCATAPYTTETFHFPTPTLTSTEVYDYFLSEFGFSRTEVRELMLSWIVDYVITNEQKESKPLTLLFCCHSFTIQNCFTTP